MFRKLTIAVAIAASLGAALAPSIASAKGMGGMGGHPHFGHFGGFGVVGAIAATAAIADAADESCFVTQRVMTPYGYRFRTVNVCND